MKSLHLSMVDMDALKIIFGNNPEAISDYLGKFTTRTADLLKDVRLAVEQKNHDAAMGYFHKLKGPTGTIGFKKMYALCEKTEEKITALDWEAAHQLCGDLESTLEKLRIELTK